MPVSAKICAPRKFLIDLVEQLQTRLEQLKVQRSGTVGSQSGQKLKKCKGPSEAICSLHHLMKQLCTQAELYVCKKVKSEDLEETSSNDESEPSAPSKRIISALSSILEVYSNDQTKLSNTNSNYYYTVISLPLCAHVTSLAKMQSC